MITIEKKFVVDDKGAPKEVIISLEDYQKIVELLGLDLDDEAISDLRRAKKDRESGNKNAYMELGSIQ